MTQEEIIALAREAGFHFHDAGYAPILHSTGAKYSEKCFERFAALVAAREREACALICDRRYNFEASRIAQIIRERGQP